VRPFGLVAFLFTDLVDSTPLWSVEPKAMAASLAMHDDILRAAIERHRGYVFATGGDSFSAAFARASDAVAATHAINAALQEATWSGPALTVRMGLHLGEAEERDANYYGLAVSTAARVANAGHGGQVLLTDPVLAAIGSELDVTLLGNYRFKGVPGIVRIWQIGDDQFPPLRSVGRSNVPTSATTLVGRSADVDAVRQLLAHHRAVTIAAAGGMGKTRLAIEVADAEQDRWPDGVHFVDLTNVSDAGAVASVVAGAVGAEVRSDPTADLVRYVAGRELLIVLDNCEHLVDSCADLVVDILRAGGRSKILTTSREWLDIDGEHVYRLGPLDVTGTNGAAVALFVERARATEPAFDAGGATLDEIRAVCERLDGIPLAIELAASRVSVLPPGELLANLHDRFRLLSGGRRRSRGRTLSATVDWSYDLLDPEQQRIFRALGVFAGPFDLRAVAAVCEIPLQTALDETEALYHRSLVARVDDSPGRFRLLETLKSYAEDRLLDTGEAETVRRRHTDHFLERSSTESVLVATSWSHLSEIVPYRHNLLACADSLEVQERWDELARLLGVLAYTSWGDAVTMLYRLERCRPSVTDRELRDWLTMGASYLHMAMADWWSYIEAAKDLLRSDNPRSVAVGHRNMSLVLARLDPDAASDRIDRYAELYGDDPTGELARSVRTWRCVAAAHSDDLQAATALAEEMLRDAGTVLPDLLPWVSSVQVLGVDAWLHDRPDDIAAIADIVDARVDVLASSDFSFNYTVAFTRALAAVAGSDRDAALMTARRHALDSFAGRVGHAEGDALVLLAELARREGDDDRARELLVGVGAARGQASALAASRLASMLGVRTEIEAAFRQHLFDQAWLLDRPKRVLLDEVERRGWTPPPPNSSQ
jgi:predicted ATPase/class 3 adenylate cyclase